MRPHTLVLALFAVSISGVDLTAAAPHASGERQTQTAPSDERSGMEAAGKRWEQQGVQVGQSLDDVAVFTLEGKAAKLALMWKERPALIVTASLTCPVARERCPNLQAILEEFNPEVRVLVLYTIDAHPKGDDSPYSPGREWVTQQNEKTSVLHAQPNTLEERLELARELHERLGGLPSMIVDAMDNKAWQTLGSGPNLAVLVDTDGQVIAKQGWLDAEAMRESIDALLKQRVTLAASAYEIGKKARPRMDAFIEALQARDRAKMDSFYAAHARGWFDQKTGEGTPIAASPWRAWDDELHVHRAIGSARIEANKVVVISSEINDFARLIDFPGWRATTTYWFNADGRITEKLYEPIDVKPSMRECFAPALDWARQHKAEELKAIYPDEQFAPTAESAKRWRDLLVEWRKATGKPAMKLDA